MSDPFDQIITTPLRTELESRYLAYALSTIIARSLPDVRDGLKPVQRRILYAMRALHLDPSSGYKKSARVVGDVIGKFHPHGDQAAYEAMVRLAQDFAVRYPLVDGQGNFGNIDGDGPAAMRYTEARLTQVAQALLEEIDLETVEMIPTYDGSLEEPVVLPARFPNLLANGSTGIAVGMATSIPPHNVAELLDGCLLLNSQPECSLEDLVRVIPGPDFPTGGILVSEEAERLAVYRTGRGSLRLRARWHQEPLGHGAWHLVVSEIPYQVPKARLIERIAGLITERKCPLLADVRDESDDRLRIVLEPRSRTADPELIMAYLFKNSDLEVRVSFNLNVITGAGRPEVLNLKQVLQAWLDHRFQVFGNKSRYELRLIRTRLHLLAAYLIVHLNIDEVVAIIKEHDDPAPVLMARFLLDKEQAEAILNLRLRSLRRLEEMAIRREIADKEGRAAQLEAMLADPTRMWQAVREDLLQIRQTFADPRRTEIGDAVKDVELKPEDMVEREPLMLILSRRGWVKTIKGHDPTQCAKIRFKEGDDLAQRVNTYSNEVVTFISVSGKIFSSLADRLPAGKGFGDPLSVFFDLDGGDPITWAMAVSPEREYFVATRLGQGFRVKGEDLNTAYRTGKQVIVFRPGDSLLHVRPVQGEEVAVICSGRRLLVCRLDEFPVLGRGQGVRIQKLLAGEVLSDLTTFTAAQGVTLDSGKRTRQLLDVTGWRGARAARGATLPHGFMSGAVFADTGTPLPPAGKGFIAALFEEAE